jgi:sensor c-di-GMP phosphodiesterase-like protein
MITLDSISQGLQNGEFYLEYLPTHSLVNENCTGAEALIRWKKGADIITPDHFIPIVENTPHSGLITYWVLEKVAEEMGDWLRANPTVHMSINVPPEILGRGGLIYAASKANINDLLPQFIFEITERGFPDKIAIDSINQHHYKNRGVRIALDDVSLAGSASLAILGRSHIDIIKLDKSLIAQITTSNLNPDWLKGISGLLQTGVVSVIAEGIETELQYEVLKQANIQEAQGFYFSKSISASAFFEYHQLHN